MKQKLIERLKDLKESKDEHWKMCSRYTFQKNCCINDCSPEIDISAREFNKIIKALEGNQK